MINWGAAIAPHQLLSYRLKSGTEEKAISAAPKNKLRSVGALGVTELSAHSKHPTSQNITRRRLHSHRCRRDLPCLPFVCPSHRHGRLQSDAPEPRRKHSEP